MRSILAGILFLVFVPGAVAQGGCLPQREMQEVVAGGAMIAPAAAVAAARQASQGGDVLRAALCRDGGGYVYRIATLRRDGRVVQVVIDAATGDVRSAQ